MKRMKESTTFGYEMFEEKFKTLLNQHLPVKTKYVRNNNAPFLTKRIRKEIMLRSKRRNSYIKCPNAINWISYKLQRNKCLSLIRKAKKEFYRSLDMKILSDQGKFWKTVRPIFSEKAFSQKLTSLVENGEVISDSGEIAEVMNDYFTTITKTLEIPDVPTVSFDPALFNGVDDILNAYRNHPSILAIRNFHSADTEFQFSQVGLGVVKKHIRQLNEKKASPLDDIPARVLKQFSESYADVLTDVYNTSLSSKVFPGSLKMADVSPLFKHGDRSNRGNFRPISKLPCLSKVYERVMFDDINTFMSSRMSPLLSGFRSRYSTQHALISMIHKWHRELDSGSYVGAILMDLSKAFDCINHNLLIAKLHAYGFSRNSLEYIYSYLSDRQQRVVVEGVPSTWKDIEIGVPQGSILGPLLFNIYINDLFLFIEDPKAFICNYADDNTLYSADKDPEILMKRLHSNMVVVSAWFQDNGLKLNADKCKLIVLKGFKNVNYTFSLNLNNEVLIEVPEVKLLGIVIDNKLSYKKHVEMLCKRVSSKVSALQRISPHLSDTQHRFLANSFISSEFNYCPLIWSFTSRESLHRVQHLQDRVERMSPECSHVSIHRRNCELLLKEMYKTKHCLNPSYMKEVFHFRDFVPYNTRAHSDIRRPLIRTTRFGLQTPSYIGAQLWDALPNSVREADSLESFMSLVRDIPDLQCRCRLCADFISGLGYIS